jgi:hypothetical protein
LPFLTLWPYALAGLLAFGAGWTTNGWRLGAELSDLKTTQAQAAEKGISDVRDAENAFRQRAEAAARAAQSRNGALSADAANARAESERLRDLLTATRADIAESSRASLDEYATAISVVFDQCERAYQELARAADGHASDARTLIDAWPKR